MESFLTVGFRAFIQRYTACFQIALSGASDVRGLRDVFRGAKHVCDQQLLLRLCLWFRSRLRGVRASQLPSGI